MCARAEAGPVGPKRGLAAVPTQVRGAWPNNEPTHPATRQHTQPHRCEGLGGAWLRCPRELAGPGRASRRRAERSSRRGRAGRAAVGDLSGNKQQAERPPPTHTPSSPARRTAHATPATPVGPQHHTAARQPNTPRRHNKAARPHRGRAAQPVSVTHRRITTMSGSPRPLSWRTLEMPSLAATSFAVPSMRGSS